MEDANQHRRSTQLGGRLQMNTHIMQVQDGWRIVGFGRKHKELKKAIAVATEFLTICARLNAADAAKAWRAQ